MADAQLLSGEFASASRPGRLTRALAVLFLVLLPFSSISFGLPIGEFDHNASLPVLVLLLMAILLSFGRRAFASLSTRDVCYSFLLAILVYMAWCATITLITGVVFEYQALDAFGFSPFTHSIGRFPIPLFLGMVIFASFIVARFILPPRNLERGYFIAAIIVTVYGWIQLYALEFHPDWYRRLAVFFEAGRISDDHRNVDYVALRGRLNLMTYEAAEGARLLLILFLPTLWTMKAPDRFTRYLQGAMIASMIVFILAAETIVGLVGLAVFLGLVLFLAPARSRALLAIATVAAAIVAFVLIPEDFVDRLRTVLTNPGLAQADQSALTRAAFAYASMNILLEHPIFGIGWSKDIFFMANAMPEWGNTWEATRSLSRGESVSAKSLAIRLLLYGGIPAFLAFSYYYLRLFFKALRNFRESGNPVWKRLILILATFGVCSTIDGGILASFYPWAALGFVLGSGSLAAAQEEGDAR